MLCLGKNRRLWNKILNLSVNGELENIPKKASKELTEFHKPVLILWGVDGSELFPIELGRRLKSIFSNSTFVAIENSKTYVQENKPRVFVDDMKRFVE